MFSGDSCELSVARTTSRSLAHAPHRSPRHVRCCAYDIVARDLVRAPAESVFIAANERGARFFVRQKSAQTELGARACGAGLWRARPVAHAPAEPMDSPRERAAAPWRSRHVRERCTSPRATVSQTRLSSARRVTVACISAAAAQSAAPSRHAVASPKYAHAFGPSSGPRSDALAQQSEYAP